MATWIGVIFLLAVPGHALNWRQCVLEAAEANPRVTAARESVAAARAAARAARAGYLPSVSISASQGRSKTIIDNIAISPSAVNQMRAGVSGSWNLFQGFGTEAAVERAEAAVRTAEADLAAAEASVRAALRRAFGRLLSAQETIGLSETIAARLSRNADFIHLRYEGGVEARWGWLKAAADAKDADWQLQQALLNLRAAQRTLGESLGRTVYEPLEAEGGLAAAGPEPLEAALARVDVTPAMRREEAAVASAEAGLRSSKSDWWPSFDMTGSYSRSGDSWSVADKAWSVNGALSYPIFQGGSVVEGLRENRRRLEAARKSRLDVRNQAARRIEASYAETKAAVDRVPVSRAQLEASRERTDTVQALYANGQATFLEWDESQTSFTRAQRSELSTRLEAYLSQAGWEEALGVGLE